MPHRVHGLEPGFLLSAPTLGDPNFEGTVVLLGAHEDGGSLGFIVNGDALGDAADVVRATGLAAEGAPLPPSLAGSKVRRGGPVSLESVWVLYARDPDSAPLAGSLTIGDALGVTSSAEALQEILAGRGPAKVRLVVGYAGWGPGQLAREVAAGAWLPADADAELVFDDDTASMWRRAYERSIGTIPTAFTAGRRGSA